MLVAGGLALPVAPPLAAQVAIKRAAAGFNLFSVPQEREVGRQSALDLERRLPLVRGARVDRVLGGIVALLARSAPASPWTYTAHVMLSTEVQLLAVPGGRTYLTQGLVALARTEADVAALVAHGMAHTILRHGTGRLSRAWADTVGFAALGGLGDRAGIPHSVVEATGGYGPEAAFLSFSPADEYEADALGAELLSRAGYDAVALAGMLAMLRREQQRLPTIRRFFAYHPAPPDREARIRNLVNVLGHGGARERVGGFSAIRWSRAAAPRTLQVSAGALPDTAMSSATPFMPNLPAPSATFARFDGHERHSLEYPANWDAHGGGTGVTFAPPGGIVERNGRPALVQGAVVNTWAPFESDVERWNQSRARSVVPGDRHRPRAALEDATDDLVRQVLRASPWLRSATPTARVETVQGRRGYAIRFGGRSPVTGELERLLVHVRAVNDDAVVYLACVTPERMGIAIERACSHMSRSLRVADPPSVRP